MKSSVPQPTLVRSKVLIPSPSGLLHRPRVCQTIGQGLTSKLTVVSAPAGYGKTAALVDFALHSPIPICWYTVDERDRDLGMFIAYIVGSIRERFPGFGERTEATLISRSGDLFHDPTSIVGELVNEMLEIDTDFIIVVDNYETLDGTYGIRAFVHRLIKVLPIKCHFMLGSRTLPDVPVTKLVAQRQLVALTGEELRFSPDEIHDLLQQSHIQVSEAQADAIAAQSEGWITGILLLADIFRQETKTVLLRQRRATAETYDYLVKEVFARQPPDIQHFLRTSAVLREISSRLCREVLQIAEPRSLLAELERRNLFITRFGEGRTATYRYHNLFRDFLHEQFHQHEPSRYNELHRRAAERFHKANDIEEAVYHYLIIQAHTEATVLMERTALEWFTRGRVETLLRWAENLPEAVRDRAPRLSLYHSKVLTDRYDYERARQALSYAHAGFTFQQDSDRLAKVYNQDAMLRLFEGQYENAIAEAQKALETLSQTEVAEQAQARRIIGRAHVGLGHLVEGIAPLRDALELFRKVGGPYDVVNLLQDLTLALTTKGHFDEAVTYLSEALAIGRRLGAPTQLAGVLNNLGWIYHMRGEYQRALELYEEGLTTARYGGVAWLQANISVGMADLHRDLGACERAEPLYNSGWQIAQESDPGLALYILAARADMYRRRGDYAKARSLLQEATRLAEEKNRDFELRGLLPMARGITLAESGEAEAGLQFLSDSATFLEEHQAKPELARARFLLAKAHMLAGDESQAVTELRHAMALAGEIGTLQFAIAESSHDPTLLRLGIAENVEACRDIAAGVKRLIGLEEGQGPGDNIRNHALNRLEIYGFGESRIVRDGLTVSSAEWQAAMPKELFFYILLHGPIERDVIGTVFWPDLSQKKTVNSFHTTLHRIRRALGAEAVVVSKGQYDVGDIDYWFDVKEFETLIERAQLLPPHEWQTQDLWQQAVTLYQGDFLSDVERTWCMSKRETLQGLYLEALIGVGRCHEARNECDEAINWYRRSLSVDELREDVYRRIMRCYDRMGRRSEALAEYHRCREVLRREMKMEASAETDRLFRQIAGRSPG